MIVNNFFGTALHGPCVPTSKPYLPFGPYTESYPFSPTLLSVVGRCEGTTWAQSRRLISYPQLRICLEFIVWWLEMSLWVMIHPAPHAHAAGCPLKDRARRINLSQNNSLLIVLLHSLHFCTSHRNVLSLWINALTHKTCTWKKRPYILTSPYICTQNQESMTINWYD